MYIGELSATFQAARAALRPVGYFVFSTETSPGDGFTIRGTGRHSHSKHYIHEVAENSGFDLLRDTDCDLRLDYGKPIAGSIYVFRSRQ